MIKRKPLLPYVNLEDLVAYRKDETATYTRSNVVNAVLDAMETVGMTSSTDIAKYLALNPNKLSNALQIATGLKLTEFRIQMLKIRYDRLQKEHPDWNAEKMTEELGFADRASLFRLIGKERYDKEVVKNRRPKSKNKLDSE